MDKQTIATTPNPKVIFIVDGDLTLKGWDASEVHTKSSSAEDLKIEQNENEIRIHCLRDCIARVPFESQVHIERVSGHAVLKALENGTMIDTVHGHLTLRNIGATTISQVHGHLTARNVAGNLIVNKVDGNVTVRDVEGDFILEDVINGNLVLKEIDGNARAVALGNVTANIDPSPGSSYSFQAHGNLMCRMPEDASVRVNITNGNKIKINIPEKEAGSTFSAPYELTLGEGDAELILSAYGNIVLSSLPPDWDLDELDVEIGEDFTVLSDTLSEQITRQVEVQMEYLEQQLESQLDNLSTRIGAAGLSAQQAERIAQRAQEAGERARRRAEERIQRAQEKMERKLEAARRRAEMKARAAERAARDRRKRTEPADWAPTPKAPVEPVSEEEHLMILQLLEQGKITTDEAEQLLAALEGKSL
jgi:regulator of protease activity HflC (stomatin/prohibitin superfamily)